MLESFLTGLLLGLGGSLHCVGMCGAIVTALSVTSKNQSFSRTSLITLCYNLGRISTYVILGVLAGFISSLADSFGFLTGLRILAAILLIITGLYLLNIWKGLLALEHVGGKVWTKVKPLTQKLNPSHSSLHAIITGMLWGLIPCGLVYSAIGVATAQGSISASILLMFAFGLGTLGPVLLMGIGFTSVAQWLKKTWLRYAFAIFMIAFGIWSLASIASHMTMNHSKHATEQHHHHHD
ncbi:sulfite exporter TauE/SafE family protein [Pleionea sediminis]|uniref:sulfite exporter TauE/SafE family protein n=1 Tax=Pleionea sediminis TaxID=2569479 RepID=UPI0011859C51|nr:sulfite exporter TauE/SafE family protein [Pleionea sediminis]